MFHPRFGPFDQLAGDAVHQRHFKGEGTPGLPHVEFVERLEGLFVEQHRSVDGLREIFHQQFDVGVVGGEYSVGSPVVKFLEKYRCQGSTQIGVGTGAEFVD